MGERYRFGGPIPESVQRLKARREYRASSLYAGVKKSRRARAEEVRDAKAGVVRVHSLASSEPIGTDDLATRRVQARAALEPFKRHDAPAGTDVPEFLSELKAIRALLERQMAIQAWSAGLQRDPFTPCPSEVPQAREEARSAREASPEFPQLLASTGCATPPEPSQCARSLRGCSGCPECAAA